MDKYGFVVFNDSNWEMKTYHRDDMELGYNRIGDGIRYVINVGGIDSNHCYKSCNSFIDAIRIHNLGTHDHQG